MYLPSVAFYLGEQKQNGCSEIVSQDNLFFVIEAGSGLPEESGHKILEYVKDKLKETQIDSLATFENFIVEIIKENNLPAGFSLSSGFIKDNILYLKTSGGGKIFIRRKNKLGLLIEGDSTASGPVEDGDFYIFLTENFFDLIGGNVGLGNSFDHRSPTEIIDEITPSLKAKNDQGAVALFVNLKKEIQSPIEGTGETQDVVNFSVKDRLIFIRQYLQSIGRQKTLTFITVFFLFLILLWSVVLGYQRRTNAEAQTKIRLTKELVTQKLSTAEDVAYLNMGRALILISDSKVEVEKLGKEIGGKRKEVDELETMISQTENKILKKEMSTYKEFFDLTVDDKNAKGSKFYLDGEIVYILDKQSGAIYQLSLEKKSLNKDQLSEIKSANIVAGDNDDSFFYVKDHGVFRIGSDGKPKKIIENDKDWGEIVDMFMYNGNIYLLDKGKDEIWKYLQGEENFGNKNSYFESGQAIDLSAVESMAIDGSVYLAGDSIVAKYTSGLRDSFKTDLPDKESVFNKVFTSKDSEKVYLWDKNKGTVFVVGKSGDYVEQINSDILNKGSDIVVYKEAIYVLVGNKIFRID